MPYPPIQTPPGYPQPQGLAARLGMAPQAPAFGSPVGQVLETVINVTFPNAPAASGFAVQRQTTSGPKYFPTDSHDPATAQRFDSFAAARRARDEHSDLWRFNGQIVEASVIPDQAPKAAGRWRIRDQSGSHLGWSSHGLRLYLNPLDPEVLTFDTEHDAMRKMDELLLQLGVWYAVQA
jgi:hypothetical protein